MSKSAPKSLFERLGGRPTYEKVHKIFYDKIFADSWLLPFFEDIDQGVLEEQQTDFQIQITGGPPKYCGKLPVAAHKHMFITEEIYMHRHELLRQSLVEAEIEPALRDEWLAIDLSFKRALIKRSPDECQKRYATDEIIIVKKPANFAA